MRLWANSRLSDLWRFPVCVSQSLVEPLLSLHMFPRLVAGYLAEGRHSYWYSRWPPYCHAEFTCSYWTLVIWRKSGILSLCPRAAHPQASVYSWACLVNIRAIAVTKQFNKKFMSFIWNHDYQLSFFLKRFCLDVPRPHSIICCWATSSSLGDKVGLQPFETHGHLLFQDSPFLWELF